MKPQADSVEIHGGKVAEAIYKALELTPKNNDYVLKPLLSKNALTITMIAESDDKELPQEFAVKFIIEDEGTITLINTTVSGGFQRRTVLTEAEKIKLFCQFYSRENGLIGKESPMTSNKKWDAHFRKQLIQAHNLIYSLIRPPFGCPIRTSDRAGNGPQQELLPQ
ncbi:MAG: hypothetical protein WCD70_13230 [Alphaproteobacteria bacterium]